MKTFKHSKPVKRNYECTNIVACQAESKPAGDWVECDESELDSLTQLWTERGVRYFGWL